MRLLFVRHGESIANTLGIVSNRDLPHPLTENGVVQAQDLAEKLGDSGAAKIYVSPILRARQTAEIVAGRLGMPVEVVDALREYDCGELEGKGDEETWRRHMEVKIAWFERGDFDARCVGGESLNDIRARFIPFVDGLLDRHQGDETIVLVGHGGTFGAILPLVVDNLTFEFVKSAPFPNTMVIEVVSTKDGWQCVNWNGQPIP